MTREKVPRPPNAQRGPSAVRPNSPFWLQTRLDEGNLRNPARAARSWAAWAPAAPRPPSGRLRPCAPPQNSQHTREKPY